MVLQGLVVGDWMSVYKVVTITPAGAPHPHHTPVSDDARQLRDRGADQCSLNSDSSAARPLSASAPFPPALLLLCDATHDPPSAPWTSHLWLLKKSS